MAIEKIDIKNEFGFQELDKRLRNVSLRGFPDVKIYGNSAIDVRTLSPEQVRQDIFTPQPSVYSPQLEQVYRVDELFSEKGINIFRLNGGVDYEATDDKGKVTEWAIIPPAVEVLPIKFIWGKGLDYSDRIGPELKALMEERGYSINPEVENLDYPEYQTLRKVFNGHTGLVPEICDGSHRIEVGVRKGLEQNLLFIERVKFGFPYYAAPKPYSAVHEESERVEEKLDKTHVLTSPGHKLLYRLFPTGGINSGNVRSSKQKFD